MRTRIFPACLLFFATCVAPIFAVEAPEGMSLEELVKLDIPGLMTRSNEGISPSAVTRITEEDIRLTPARNIYDLLEVYVPGAFWLIHNEGHHMAIRGLSSDRETKILLLVNGVKINQDAYAGAVDEIINWDLNDIREIQVVRGPGSVTYGPGAIEAVINIITKSGEDALGHRFGWKSDFTYRSEGGFYSYGMKKENLGLFVYGSVVGTRGMNPVARDVDNNGYVGQVGVGPFLSGRPTGRWFRDFRGDRPQVKLHTQVDLFKEWIVRVRYNQAGWTQEPYQTRSPLGTADTEFSYERQMLHRYLLATVENKHEFSDKVTVKTEVGVHSYDRIKDEATPVVPYYDSVRNRNPVFGSNKAFGSATVNLALSEKVEVAANVRYVNEYIYAGWNRSPQDMYIYGIVSGPDSNRPGTYYVGEGWYTQTFSTAAEANLRFAPKLNLILSGRADKNNNSRTFFSPRVAVLSDWGGAGVYKLVLQKAQRMNDLGELLIAKMNNVKTNPEELKGVQLGWESPKGHMFDVSIYGYFNEIDLLGFNQTTKNITRIGTAQIGGAELEIRKSVGGFTGGVNHSYADLAKFKLGPDVSIASMTYAEIRSVSGGGTLIVNGTGNNLNNWANHATKLFARYKAGDHWTFNGDLRIFWGFEGRKDALEMYKNAKPAPGTTLNAARYYGALGWLDYLGTGDAQWRVDFSAEYAFNENIALQVYSQNLVGDKMYRYGFDGGANRVYPVRFEYAEEPTTVGAKLEVRL